MKMKRLADLRFFSPRYAWQRLVQSMTGSWYFRGDRMSEDRRRLMLCSYSSNAIANLVGGSFWTGLLLLLEADDAFIGTLSMISISANMLQMFAPLLLERFPQRKRIIMILRGVVFLVNILFIGLIPLFPVDQQARLGLTAVSVLFVNVISALIAPGITVWHLQSIPQRVRTGFYAFHTMTVGGVVAIVNFLGGKLVDLFKAGGNEYWGLFALRIVALGLAVFDLFLYSRIEEYPYEAGEAAFRLRDLFVKPFRERKYLRTVAAVVLWNLAANIPGAYYTVYLLQTVEVSYSYLMMVNLINVVVVLFLTPVWRKVVMRMGWFKTLYLAMGLFLLHYIGLAFVQKGTTWIYLVSAVWSYLMAIGINLSFTSIPYVNIPQKNQTVFIGFYSTAGNFAALLGVTIGKYFVLQTEGISLTIAGVAMGNKQLLVLLTAAMMAISAIGIWWAQRSVSTAVEE